MRTFFSFIIFCFLSLGLAFPAQAGFSSVFTDKFSGTVEQVYTPSEDIETVLPTAIGSIIQLIIGFAGVILLIIITYASFLWLTARGNEDQVTKAKAWLRNGIIGLIITLMAFAITSFIVNSVRDALRQDRFIDPGAIPGVNQDPTAPRLPGQSGQQLPA